MTGMQSYSGHGALGELQGVGVEWATVPLSFFGFRLTLSRLEGDDRVRRVFCDAYVPSREGCSEEPARRRGALHAVEGGAFLAFPVGTMAWLEVGGEGGLHWASARVTGDSSGRSASDDVDARWGSGFSAGLTKGGLLGTPLLATLRYVYRRADLSRERAPAAYAPFSADVSLHQVRVGLSYAW